ncbi:hypothetical protein HanXRQr2_Chr00c011g0832791 [Helianthus annuus]|uniref:Uncharacterized protein n=1 Tax=Helianthus annuus TaxID=4232 RepID=A0A9K3P5H9_HELAN|nr:hypothetical protein HanXRQr2_Chr00c011g0832791 [Helianthus annuus]KAJ0464335.1 hypothetical protein HanHA300_Chr14g0525991 [Helianthus annuus]KAJ0464336.1 hypothetical protein HanHA300_Chr14g0526001 [Helianthus annuus]
MDHLSYIRVRRRSYGTKGFRLNSKRFCVQRLRAKIFNFFRIVIKAWKSRLYTMRTTMTTSKSNYGSSRGDLVSKTNAYRLHVCRQKSFTRTNSFYSEAIADCLEFIKRSSVSLDDKEDTYTINEK